MVSSNTSMLYAFVIVIIFITALYESYRTVMHLIVDSPTRDNNILDIFATNGPSFIADCKVILGISDHEVVYEETQLN